jgi:glucosyl-dolichyl phosphate glucuronosyltransferase
VSGETMAHVQPTLTLTAIVCAYTEDRWSDICRAVDGLLNQELPVDQVVVVCDYNDKLYERFTTARPDVACLKNTQTKGLSGARNTGVAAATSAVVAFVDDDAYPATDWSRRVLDAYDDDVIGVGGGVLPDWRAARPRWLPEEFLWVIGCSYRGQPTTVAEVRNGIGANMSFRRSVFDGIGGFDARIGRIGANAAGCEETEFSIRAKAANPAGRILLEPLAVCHHAVTPDRLTKSYFRKRCSAEGFSKALVTSLVGADSALGTERSYVTRTLPLGCLAGVQQAVHGDRAALSRSVAIIEGLLITTFAYVRARLTLRGRGRVGLADDARDAVTAA